MYSTIITSKHCKHFAYRELHKTYHVKSHLGPPQSQARVGHRQITKQMQVNDLLEPNVRIRELKEDHVNFVLENVDLSYALQLASLS